MKKKTSKAKKKTSQSKKTKPTRAAKTVKRTRTASAVKGTKQPKITEEEKTWEEIIPQDQLSGSSYSGIESGEIKETIKEKEKIASEGEARHARMENALPSPKRSADRDSSWKDSNSVMDDLEGEELESSRFDSASPEIIVTPGQYIEANFESFDKNKMILRGKVIEMFSNRAVPDIDEMVVGTPQDPALLIEIYEEMEDGRWRPTGKLTGLKMSELQRGVQVFNQR